MSWFTAFSLRVVLVTACGVYSVAAQGAADCWRLAGRRHGIDPLLLFAMASVESSFDAAAVHRNRDGSEDVGLMQINSQHLPDLARRGITRQRLIDEPCLSIDVGASLLSDFIKRHGYTWRAVGAYNAGGTRGREAARARYVERVWPLYEALTRERARRRASHADAG